MPSCKMRVPLRKSFLFATELAERFLWAVLIAGPQFTVTFRSSVCAARFLGGGCCHGCSLLGQARLKPDLLVKVLQEKSYTISYEQQKKKK